MNLYNFVKISNSHYGTQLSQEKGQACIIDTFVNFLKNHCQMSISIVHKAVVKIWNPLN
jgi:hypothetical protein